MVAIISGSVDRLFLMVTNTLIFHKQKHAIVKSKRPYRQHEQHDIFRIVHDIFRIVSQIQKLPLLGKLYVRIYQLSDRGKIKEGVV